MNIVLVIIISLIVGFIIGLLVAIREVKKVLQRFWDSF